MFYCNMIDKKLLYAWIRAKLHSNLNASHYGDKWYSIFIIIFFFFFIIIEFISISDQWSG